MNRVIFALGLLLCALAIGFGSSERSEANARSATGGSELASGASRPVGARQAAPDCSLITRFGLEKQTNLHAADLLRQCGHGSNIKLPAYRPPPSLKSNTSRPDDYGGPDVNVITGQQPFPYNAQFRSYVWGNGNTVVVVYNDSTDSPFGYSGLSWSTDGGSTFTRIQPSPFSSGHGTSFGDPTVVYNASLSRWYATSLATGCGGQGIGLWTSTDGVAWSAGACAHNGPSDDRHSMWVDNSPSSPWYGRMYISWNNFAVVGGALQSTFSDNGTTWSAPVQVQQTSGFIRNVNIAGNQNNGAVYLVGLDEGAGGGFSPRTSILYRSTSGGANWTAHSMNGPFAAPGAGQCGYFTHMPSAWSDMGWGQLSVDANGTLHYAHTIHGEGSDLGDIYYTRSMDDGASWTTPLRLNTDTTAREQWQPSLSVASPGTVMVGWYDRRETTGHDYRYWGRRSTDGGLTWQPDQPVSDAVSPDLSGQGCLTNYSHHSASGSTSYLTWTDSRTLVDGTPQPDVYFDRVTLGGGTPTRTSTPGASGAYMELVPEGNAPPNGGTAKVGDRFVLGLWLYSDPETEFPTGQMSFLTFTHSVLQNARVDHIEFACVLTNTITPDLSVFDAVLQNEVCNGPNPCNFPIGGMTDPGSIAYSSGAILQWPPGDFRLAQVGLCVVAPGRAVLHWQFSPPAPPNRDTQIVDWDGTRLENPALFTDYVINVAGGPTLTPTPTPTQCPVNYTHTIAAGTVVPGTTDTGNHCDDCTTAITLPFGFRLYDQTFTLANVNSNGILTFGAGSSFISCPTSSGVSYAIWAYMEDLVTISTSTCNPGPCGIYTSISGSAPNRVLNIEWRAAYFAVGGSANFEIRLYENAPGQQFDFIYGRLDHGAAPAGVAKDSAMYTCFTGSPVQGLRVIWTLPPCGSVTATPSLTPTITNTRTITRTPTPCVNPYWYSTATATIVPGTLDTGNHCDDCTTAITLPFQIWFYGQTFNSARVGSNGLLHLDDSNAFVEFKCLPVPGIINALMVYYDDLVTDCIGCGVFTSISGSAPNRMFNIEWRAATFGTNNPVNFEVRLREWMGIGFVYGQVAQQGSSATVGVQGRGSYFTQFSCNTPSLRENLSVTWGLVAACEATISPTYTRTRTHTPTPTITFASTSTPTYTPTPCTAFGTWTGAAAIPAPRGRALGVNYSDSVYLFGGRPDGSTYTDTIYRYDLASDSWMLITSTMPDLYTSNMAGGLLTFPEGERIFLTGGSGDNPYPASRSLAFDPATNTFANKALWPAFPSRLPGGWAVANNKLYIFGGFVINEFMMSDIYVYDPMVDQWTRLNNAQLSIARGYIAAEKMPDGLIYLAGGSQYVAGFLTDQTRFEKFNPADNTITLGPNMAYARSNNHGYNFRGKFVVPAGGALTFTDDVQMYDPATDSWSLTSNIPHAVRNYAKGYGPDGSILVIGGTDDEDNFFNYNQKFAPGGSCATPTITSTPTSGTPSPTLTGCVNNQCTPPPSSTPTLTPCVLSFSDVMPTDYFYEAVQYLACLGVISGYVDDTFRPYNNATRGQLTKIVVLAMGWELIAPGEPTFADVPASHVFWRHIETAYFHEIIGGYSDGSFRPGNNITRGQLCKIITQAMSWKQVCPSTGHFSDVPPDSAFYCYVETAYEHNIISGYGDGTFRPGNSATRGQICVIIYRAITEP